MKLSTTLQKIQKTTALLENISIIGKGGRFLVTNFQDLKTAFNILEETNILSNVTEEFKRVPFYHSADQQIDITPQWGEILKNLISKTTDILVNVINTLASALNIPDDEENLNKYLDNEENCIFIKLPHSSDLNGLTKNISIFNTILSQTILEANVDGKIELERVEPGSIWLKVCLGSSAAVTLIGTIAWSAAVITKKYNEAKYFEKLVEHQELALQEKKLLLDAQDKILKIVINAEAKNIYNNHYNKKEFDPESFERLKKMLEQLMLQMTKGAELTPALPESEKVENLFPDMNNLSLIESKIKKIEQ